MAISIGGAVALVSLVLVAHLAPAPLKATQVSYAIFDIIHVLGFAVITVLGILFLLQRRADMQLEAGTIYVLVPVALICLAGLSELAQSFVGRAPKFADVFRDLCGISAGVLITLAMRPGFLHRIGSTILGLILLTAGLLGPLGRLIAGTVQ